MQRTTIAKRFLPLAVFLVVQLLIIALAPSKAPQQADRVGVSTGPGVTTPEGFVVDPETGQLVDPVTGEVIESGTSGTPGSSGPAGSTASAPGAGGATGNVTAAGDTSHCVNGRQFDPALYAYAPPCAPKFVGNNGGTTAKRGVTKDTIKVIFMRGNYGVAVNTALQASGTSPSTPDLTAFVQTAVSFINAKYELYGRKISIEVYQIQCGTGGQGPPDNECLRNEMRQVVQERNPYAVIWETSVSSETFQELSRLGVVNIGGYGFTDSFSAQNAPYHWDLLMGGNQMANHVAEWYCKRLHGQKAAYAGDPTLQASTRKLGLLSTDDPDNKLMVSEFLRQIDSRCGVKSGDVPQYYYAQDATTADVQRREAVGKMKAPPSATSVMCFCDEVAPAFLYDEQDLQGYYPENLFVSAGFTDLDSVVQTYDHLFDPQRAEHEYPQMENAFGLAQMGRQESRSAAASGRVWKAMGKPGEPPYGSAHRDWDYLSMLATMLQAAGPNLNAQTMAANVQRLPQIRPANGTDERLPPRSLQGDYTWNDGLREVYWSPAKKSEHNLKSGRWMSLHGGRWFNRGEHLAAPLALPGKPR